MPIMHFVSEAFLLCSNIGGRNGNYGATVSIIGIFNTKKRAEIARKEFSDNYADSGVITERSVWIEKIKPGKINEVIIADIYE